MHPSRRSLLHLWSHRPKYFRGSRRRTPRSPRGPPTRATASRTSTGVMLSSSSRGAPGRERLVDLRVVAHLDRQRQVRPRRPRAPHRLADPAGQRRVVLLDQDRVVEPGAVVDAAAVGDRRLLEPPQPRRGLARVEDLRRRRPRRAPPRPRARSASRSPTAGRGSSAPCARRSAAPARCPRRRARPRPPRATRPPARAARPRRDPGGGTRPRRSRAPRSRPAPSG